MIYRTTRLSAPVAKLKKHVCYGRPAAVYFTNEKELIRWIVRVFFLGLTFLGLVLLIKSAPAPCERAIYARSYRTETTIKVYEVQPPLPSVQPVFDSSEPTNLVTEQAEQNTEAVAQIVEQQLCPEYGAYNDSYEGLSGFWSDDVFSNFFANIGALLKQWFFANCSTICILFGSATLIAVDTGLRSIVRLPGRKRKLKIKCAKSHGNIMLSFRRRAWNSWNICSWWAA